MSRKKTDNGRLIFLPLGGAGEIGMNCYVFGYGPAGRERLIVVDLGVTFPDMEGTPGVDLIMPDIAWLEENVDRIEAIFITHAHEDHIGGLAHLWPRLGKKVYCRRFTANIARRKMEEHGRDVSVIRELESFPAMVDLGPLRVGFMPVPHSIPEASGLVIDTPAGRVVHTGDFKLDPTPIIGDPYDPNLWEAVAAPGVQALICDSTNVFTPHSGRSEATVGPEITRLVSEAKNMVVATTFASNIARLQTLADAGRAAGRSVVLLGRAMRRMIEAGVESGVVTNFPPVISAEEARDMPREKVMLIVTGSQGERRAASAQLSRGKYQGLSLREGDLFLFSSKTIPGNEIGVGRIINAFSEMGVDVVDDSSSLYHVSGHANRPDLQKVHQLINPKMLVPMHGEHRHLREHARLGEAAGIPSAICTNGTMLDLAGKAPRVVDHVETGRTYLDGARMIGALDGVVRDRIRMALNGIIVVGILIDEDDEIAGDAWAEIKGLPDSGRNGAVLVDEIEDAVNSALERASDKIVSDDEAIEGVVRKVARQVAQDEIGKKPEVVVLVSRLVAA
ncbi:MBL fold hydrolase [Brevirhabdus pacifica]|uniref:MBL fold hydrolase n=1 Tax=Brevirhabdus pacifica TaxID=1267768 RepID=A0A1U7DKT4_9RHOB|nr:ribonuclease J [Brevirhabdus pacifica]APX90627.1 MBL fold hydrolase [Brevirhabdus pacifica]OWU78382.1 metallo-beta-lactamase [Loktanella sp. 22II-4b]PJJ85232.1 ribonuclease J [Brevirhabdus pacifica]